MSYLLPILAVVIWSFNAIVTKLAADSIDPAAIAAYRWLFAFIILLPFVMRSAWRQRQALWQQSWKLAILGLLGMCLYQCLAYYAAQSVPASLIGIGNGIIPLFTLLFSLWLLRSSPTVGLILGGFLSFFGLVWLCSNGEPYQFIRHGISRGQGLVILASLAYALYGVLLKKWALPLTTWVSLTAQILFGLLWTLPLLFFAKDNWQLNHLNLPLVLYAALAASLIAPLSWMIGIAHLDANRVSVFLNLSPVLSMLFAVLCLHESLSHSFLFGSGLVLLGVLIAQVSRKPLYKMNNNR